jgi:SAM-dependent methyltransferase
MKTYEPGTYWDNVGREVQQRTGATRSGIASDHTPFYALRQKQFFEQYLDVALAEASSVLELGPGPGDNLNRLRKHGKAVFGADVSHVMMDVAAKNGLNCIRAMDGLHIPYEDRFCDAVFTSTVLQHNSPHQAEQLLREMARVAAREVHLFEDTAVVPVRDRKSHWLRRSSWYIRRLESRGFELTFHSTLPLAGQEMAAALARVTMDRTRAQGAPPSARRLQLEATLLRVARPIDRHAPPVLGLSRMSFRRRQQ